MHQDSKQPSNQMQTEKYSSKTLALIAAVIIILIGIIGYIAYQYATNKALQEGHEQAQEKTYKEKVLSGDIILGDTEGLGASAADSGVPQEILSGDKILGDDSNLNLGDNDQDELDQEAKDILRGEVILGDI